VAAKVAAGDQRTATEVRDDAWREARELATARRALQATALEEALVDRPGGLLPFDVVDRDLALREQRKRDLARRMEHELRKRPDLLPGSPRWRFAWRLCEICSDAGRKVGIGERSVVFRVASSAFQAAGEELSEKMMRRVAARWRERENGTARQQIAPLASSPPA
jgi:hypothetical protein